MAPVHGVDVVPAATLKGVTGPLGVPPVEDHVGAEAFRSNRRGFLRGDDGDVFFVRSVFGHRRGSIERGARRGHRR